MSAAQTGHKVSEETVEKIRQRSIEQFLDPVARLAAAEKAKAFANTPEQIAKREYRDGEIRILLLQGMGLKKVAQMLKVSSRTAGEVRKTLVKEGLLRGRAA